MDITNDSNYWAKRSDKGGAHYFNLPSHHEGKN